ncbi:MAG: ABC transporter permease [Lachnospiraceae bacterium]
MLVAFLVAWFLLNQTRFGRYNFSIGSNEEAARLSGVNVDKWKILIYSVCGLFAGLAGIFYAGTYTTVLPGSGNGQELNAIAAVVIGGTSMSGRLRHHGGHPDRRVHHVCAKKAGLSSMGLQAHWQTFVTGFVVIGAVLLDKARTNAAAKPRPTRQRSGEGRCVPRRAGAGITEF